MAQVDNKQFYPPAIWLIGKTDPVRGMQHRMTRPFIIGRSKECQVQLEHKVVSRRHAEIICDDEKWWVRDLGSTNKVFVNDQQVEQVPLVHGSVLRLGKRIAFEVWIEGTVS